MFEIHITVMHCLSYNRKWMLSFYFRQNNISPVEQLRYWWPNGEQQ